MHLFRQRAATALLAMTAALAVGAAETNGQTAPAAESAQNTQTAPTTASAAEPAPAAQPAAPAAQPAAEPAKKQPSPHVNRTTSDYLARPEVLGFLQKLSDEKAIPLEWLKEEVAVARYSPLSEKYTTPRPKADRKKTPEKNFILYRRNLINDERIERGGDFIARNREVLARIERETGVDPYVVTAIIGIESIYGRNMGRFRVLDALMTLSFDYTRRAKYYQSELASFLDFCYRQGVSPVSVQGSFAGAMGLGQFMPASLNAYGRDGDGDGMIDITNSEPDGIASVANFLKVHGWIRGEKPLYPVEADEAIFKATKSGGIKAHTTVGKLLEAGVKPKTEWKLKNDEPALLRRPPVGQEGRHQRRRLLARDRELRRDPPLQPELLLRRGRDDARLRARNPRQGRGARREDRRRNGEGDGAGDGSQARCGAGRSGGEGGRQDRSQGGSRRAAAA